MEKRPDEPIVVWMNRVQEIASQLQSSDCTVTSEDIIVILTRSLPSSYHTYFSLIDKFLEYQVDTIINGLLVQEANNVKPDPAYITNIGQLGIRSIYHRTLG